MLKYTVSLPAPATHHVEVALTVEVAPGSLELWMPTWAPGSYLIREFARNVRHLRAADAAGRALVTRRVDKHTFRVEIVDAGLITVRYGLFLFEMSVRTSFVDDTQAMLNGTSVFLAVTGYEARPSRVTVELPEGWLADSGLPLVEESAGAVTWEADDYDHLVDCPIQLGEYQRVDFEAAGVPHRIAIVGGGNHDAERLCADTTRLVEIAAHMFGGLPYRNYLFVLQQVKAGRGGLEHRNSSVLQFSRFGHTDDKAYHELLTLISHEHFHVWNVKRIRPREFVPYDLRNETYTRMLWVCEGVTAYYDELLPHRAGLVTRKKYLEQISEEITRIEQSPGSQAQDLEEASLLTWIRFYRPDEDFANSAISYYRKGALVALLLDLEIRRRSGSARSLDDVLRALHARHGDGRTGFDAAEFEALAADIAGEPLADFFARAVRGTDPLDFAAAVQPFGLTLVRRPRDPEPAARDLIGVRMVEGGLLVDGVDRGSPAERAGLSARDEVLAVNDHRVSAATLGKRLLEARGRQIEMVVFRDDRLRTFAVDVPAQAFAVARLEVSPQASREELDRLERWLGGAAAHARQA